MASLDPTALMDAKQCQAELFLGDDDAAEIVKGMTQAVVVAKMEAAAELASARSVNKVGRCRLTVSYPILKALTVPALETGMS
jgi:hypothetical protein